MCAELDRRLVNVLQIDPRATWAKVGKGLGMSPTTVAHRWQRLVDDGIAWITACPNLDQQMTAIVEVDCHTESLPQVIKTLCANPMIVSVYETTGDRDLLLTVVAPDLPTLSDMVIDWIGGLRGVHGSRSALVTSVVIARTLGASMLSPSRREPLPKAPGHGSCGCCRQTIWIVSWPSCLRLMDVPVRPPWPGPWTFRPAPCIAGCKNCSPTGRSSPDVMSPRSWAGGIWSAPGRPPSPSITRRECWSCCVSNRRCGRACGSLATTICE